MKQEPLVIDLTLSKSKKLVDLPLYVSGKATTWAHLQKHLALSFSLLNMDLWQLGGPLICLSSVFSQVFRQVTSPLCASVNPSKNGDPHIYLTGVLWGFLLIDVKKNNAWSLNEQESIIIITMMLIRVPHIYPMERRIALISKQRNLSQ